MRVAIVFDWLTLIGGAERVLAEMINLYPTADIFAVIDFLEDRRILQGRPVTTSFIQQLPFACRFYRRYLPLMPLAIEQWDFSAYDLVLSSSYAVAKGVLTGPDQRHVAYIHTPMRYAWDLQSQYLGNGKLSRLGRWAARWMLHSLRLWDYLSGQRPDVLIANSGFVAKRIAKYWRRDAETVYPPVDMDRFQVSNHSEDFYLTISRLVPYKRIDLMISAFAAMPQRKLVVIGDGPELARLRASAPTNVVLLGAQPDHVVEDHLSRCRAFILAAVEDFGIAPLEAQAAGKPVIALAKGGALETLRNPMAGSPTAVFFHEQTAASLCQAVEELDRQISLIDPLNCRANAERFAPSRFREALSTAIQRALEQPS